MEGSFFDLFPRRHRLSRERAYLGHDRSGNRRYDAAGLGGCE